MIFDLLILELPQAVYPVQENTWQHEEAEYFVLPQVFKCPAFGLMSYLDKSKYSALTFQGGISCPACVRRIRKYWIEVQFCLNFLWIKSEAVLYWGKGSADWGSYVYESCSALIEWGTVSIPGIAIHMWSEI